MGIDVRRSGGPQTPAEPFHELVSSLRRTLAFVEPLTDRENFERWTDAVNQIENQGDFDTRMGMREVRYSANKLRIEMIDAARRRSEWV